MIIFFVTIFCPLFWFLFASACFVLELSFPGFFYFLACSFSALLLSGVTFLIPDLGVFGQLLLFLTSVIVSFFLLKKFVKKSESEIPVYKSHLDTLIGKEGEVTREITAIIPGQVRIKNEVWLAYTIEKEAKIVENTKVIVVGIRGVHVIVKEKK